MAIIQTNLTYHTCLGGDYPWQGYAKSQAEPVRQAIIHFLLPAAANLPHQLQSPCRQWTVPLHPLARHGDGGLQHLVRQPVHHLPHLPAYRFHETGGHSWPSMKGLSFYQFIHPADVFMFQRAVLRRKLCGYNEA